MKKLMLVVLIGLVALTPALVLAQTGSSGTGSRPAPGSSSSPSGTVKPAPAPGSSSSPSSPSTTQPGSSTGSGSPAASPSMGNSNTLPYHTQAECEKAGGLWIDSSKACNGK